MHSALCTSTITFDGICPTPAFEKWPLLFSCLLSQLFFPTLLSWQKITKVLIKLLIFIEMEELAFLGTGKDIWLKQC